jgi:hypothetical protein
MTSQDSQHKQESTKYDVAASGLFQPLQLIIDAVAFLGKENNGIVSLAIPYGTPYGAYGTYGSAIHHTLRF